MTNRVTACEANMTESCRRCAQEDRREHSQPIRDMFRSRSLLSVHPDCDNRQSRIGTIRTPVDGDDDLIRVGRANRNGHGQFDAFPRLVGRTSADRRMQTMLVVPGIVTIKPSLQGTYTDGQYGNAQPDAQRPEESLDLAVEGRLADLLRREYIRQHKVAVLPKEFIFIVG